MSRHTEYEEALYQFNPFGDEDTGGGSSYPEGWMRKDQAGQWWVKTADGWDMTDAPPEEGEGPSGPAFSGFDEQELIDAGAVKIGLGQYQLVNDELGTVTVYNINSRGKYTAGTPKTTTGKKNTVSGFIPTARDAEGGPVSVTADFENQKFAFPADPFSGRPDPFNLDFGGDLGDIQIQAGAGRGGAFSPVGSAFGDFNPDNPGNERLGFNADATLRALGLNPNKYNESQAAAAAVNFYAQSEALQRQGYSATEAARILQGNYNQPLPGQFSPGQTNFQTPGGSQVAVGPTGGYLDQTMFLDPDFFQAHGASNVAGFNEPYANPHSAFQSDPSSYNAFGNLNVGFSPNLDEVVESTNAARRTDPRFRRPDTQQNYAGMFARRAKQLKQAEAIYEQQRQAAARLYGQRSHAASHPGYRGPPVPAFSFPTLQDWMATQRQYRNLVPAQAHGATNYAGFGNGFTTDEPILMSGMFSGEPKAIAGEEGPEQIDVIPFESGPSGDQVGGVNPLQRGIYSDRTRRLLAALGGAI